MTREDLIARLEEAGATLLALKSPGLFPSIRMVADLGIVRDWEGYGWDDVETRPAQPSNAAITRMDEVLAWLNLHLPSTPATLKLIVGARMLVHPVSGRHLWPWRKLGRRVGADHKAVQRWHAEGLDKIIKSLAQTPQKTLCNAPRSRPHARVAPEPLFIP